MVGVRLEVDQVQVQQVQAMQDGWGFFLSG